VSEPFLAIGGKVGDVADLAERLGEILGGIAIVFDDEQTHDEAAISRIGDFPR
jgi:hypothetical protein